MRKVVSLSVCVMTVAVVVSSRVCGGPPNAEPVTRPRDERRTGLDRDTYGAGRTREQRLPAQMQGDPRVAYRQAHGPLPLWTRLHAARLAERDALTPEGPRKSAPAPERRPLPVAPRPVPPRMTARSYPVLAGSFHRCRAAARAARAATANPAARAARPGIWAATPWPSRSGHWPTSWSPICCSRSPPHPHKGSC